MREDRRHKAPRLRPDKRAIEDEGISAEDELNGEHDHADRGEQGGGVAHKGHRRTGDIKCLEGDWGGAGAWREMKSAGARIQHN